MTTLQPIWPDTRIRTDHNTAGDILSYAQNEDVVSVSETFTATVPLVDTDGKTYQMIGDKWGHVTYVNNIPVSGWIAIVHLGREYCKEIPEVPTKEIANIITLYTDGTWQSINPI